ncbi:MAG: hypothetical protein ACRDUV_02685 [Pseudonocardiaceae bacterium]
MEETRAAGEPDAAGYNYAHFDEDIADGAEARAGYSTGEVTRRSRSSSAPPTIGCFAGVCSATATAVREFEQALALWRQG